jgi:hypothetical protein
VPPLETRGIALLLLFEVGLVGGETGCFGGKHRPVTVLLVHAKGMNGQTVVCFVSGFQLFEGARWST